MQPTNSQSRRRNSSNFKSASKRVASGPDRSKAESPKGSAGTGILPPLKKILSRLKKNIGLNWKRDALSTYEIAADVAKVKLERATYGSRAVETLAEGLRQDRSTLYRWASVPETWPRSEFSRFAGLRSKKSGLPLTWSHFELLAKEKNAKSRKALIKVTLDEALTVAALAERQKGGDQMPPGGSLPVGSARPALSVWNRAHDLADELTGVAEELASMGAKPLTEENLELMKELHGKCQALMDAISPLVKITALAPLDGAPLRMAQ